MTGRIVVLNGPSSAGKTTVGAALQGLLGPECVHLPIDLFFQSVSKGRKNNWQLFELLTEVLFEAARAYAVRGADVVVDTVFERQDCVVHCRRILEGMPLFLVGLTCDVSILEARETIRGDRRPGQAAGQATRVHGFCDYDLSLDTGQDDALTCAQQIARLLQARASHADNGYRAADQTVLVDG